MRRALPPFLSSEGMPKTSSSYNINAASSLHITAYSSRHRWSHSPIPRALAPPSALAPLPWLSLSLMRPFPLFLQCRRPQIHRPLVSTLSPSPLLPLSPALPLSSFLSASSPSTPLPSLGQALRHRLLFPPQPPSLMHRSHLAPLAPGRLPFSRSDRELLDMAFPTP